MLDEVHSANEAPEADFEPAGLTRRGALECMVWAGTGMLWTLSGGVPKSLGLLGEALGRRGVRRSPSCKSATAISASTSPPIPTRSARCRRRSAKVKAVPPKPAFMIHTGDITHLSKPDEFDNADQAHRRSRPRRALRARRARRHRRGPRARPISTATARAPRAAAGTASTRTACISSACQCRGPQGRRARRSRGRAARLARRRPQGQVQRRRRSSSSPTSRCGRLCRLGLGHGRSACRRSTCLKRFGSVTVLNGHIHQMMQKVEGNMTFHTARSTAFPQPAPGTAASPGPDDGAGRAAARHARHHQRGCAQGNKPLAVIDTTLAG